MQDQRFQRLFSIIGQLSPHSQLTVHDLAAEYQVHERTIDRDLEVLRSAKLGIYCDADDTVKIHRNGYRKIAAWVLSGKE